MANITVSAPVTSVNVNTTTDTVNVSSTLSNIVVGTTVTENVDERVVSLGTNWPPTSLPNPTLDLNLGRIFVGTQVSNIESISFANISAGKSVTLISTQDTFGGWILDTTSNASAWANWEFANNFKEFDTDPFAWNILNILYDGSKYYAALSVEDALVVDTADIADGAVTNIKLANSNVIVNGTTIDLGSAGNISHFGALTTDDLTEGSTNLYYANTLVNSFIQANITTTDITEGTNLYFSNTRVNAFIQDSITTSDIDEGTNLYYTTARANSALTTYLNDNSNSPFIINGNLQVAGNIDYVNVEDLLVNDQSITLNYGNAAAQDAFIIVDRSGSTLSNVYLKWNETDDKWQLTNDGSNVYNIATFNDFSISTTAASGNGFLTYNSSTAIFEFTPADTSLATKTTDDLAEGSTNEYYTTDKANSAILGYTGDITQMGQANISRLYVGEDDIGLDQGLVNLHDFQMIKEDLYFDARQLNRNGSAGLNLAFIKGRGTVASPAVNNVRDRLVEFDYWGFNPSGTGFQAYLNTAGMWAYHDVDPNAVANVIPIAHEFWVREDGDYYGKSEQSVMALRSDRTITFNDTSTRGTATNGIGGNANITADGTFNTVSGINATGTVTANNFSGSGTTLTGIDSFGTLVVSGQSNVVADSTSDSIEFIAGSGMVLTTDAANDSITFESTGGYSDANVITLLGAYSDQINSNANIVLTDAYFEGDLNGAVTIDVNNNTAGTLNKGYAVYLDGGYSGDNPNVALANSSVASEMPAIGIVKENIAAASLGQVITSGVMNYSTHGFTLGADLFVGEGGAITTTAPTGEGGLLQKIGKVVSPNHIIIQGAFRTNAVPNLDDGNIFIGDGSNQATTAYLGSLTNDLGTSGNVNFEGGNVTIGNPSTIFGLSFLKYDYANNRLGIATGDNLGIAADGSNMFGALHILSDNSTNARINLEELRNSSSGPDVRFYKGRGSYSAPTTVSAQDRIAEQLYYAYDGTDYGSSRARMSVFCDDRSGTGYDQANGIITASHEFGVNAADGSTNIAPMQVQGGTGNVLFGLNGLRTTGTANASIGFDGTITGTTITDGTGSLTGGVLSGVTTATITTGNITTINATDVNSTNMTPDEIVLKQFNETVVALGNQSGNVSANIDAVNGSIFTMTANGDVTISEIPNAVAGSSYTLKITQDGTGSRLLTSTMKYVGGDKTLSTGAGNIDVISVVYDGTDYLASLTKDYK